MFLNAGRNKKISARNMNKFKMQVPGPCDYNPKFKKNINIYHSCFLTRSKRDKYLNYNQNPSPC